MKIRHIAAISLLVLSSFAATNVAPSKTELETMYDKAFSEFDANHYDEALKVLDAIDARQPDLAESQNLRGVVLMRKGDYNKAEAALRKALDIEPKFWNASFNLAEIPFLKKDWAEARNRFEALVAGNSDEMKGETSLLIQYKILLTFVLQGRENMVDWIINKFEGEKDSPALYYSNAALALHKNNQKEAKEWMDAAAKHYSPQLNKLFAESFYEIGWMEKPAGESRAAVEITSTAERAERMKADAQANFERAERAFQQRDFPATLKFLDLADEGAPNQAASYNLRGEVFMEEKKFDEAEDAFRKAFTADPKFREAQYNLAQIPFKKKDYAKSRERLEALFGETPGGDQNQAAQLIKYKIYMTLLLEGNDAQAQKMMDQFKFTGDTPALYYAQAAWAFKHDNPDQGNDWINSARKIYSPALNIVFADSFYDLGWLKRAPETAPPTVALAQANATPATGATPQMRFGEAENLPAPVTPEAQKTTLAAATGSAAPKGNPATAQGSPAPAPATTTGTKVPNTATTAAATPAVAPSVAPAAITASATPAQVATKVAAEIAASSPVAVGAPSAPPVQKAAAQPVPTAVAKAAPPLAARPSSAAITPAATALAPAGIRDYSRPTFAEWTDRMAEPRSLLVIALFLAGVAIFGWLVLQQVRRSGAGTAIYQSALPLTEPRFTGSTAGTINERRLRRENLDVQPPRLSLQLKGTEPSVRAAVLPSGGLGTRAKAPETTSPGGIPPSEASEFVSEVKPVVASARPPVEKIFKAPAPLPNEPKSPLRAPIVPRRDEETVSRAAAPAPPITPVVAKPAALEPKPEPVSEPAKIEKIAAALPPPPAPIAPIVPIVPIAPIQTPRPEPVGQGLWVPQLTSITASEPEKKSAEAPAPIPPEIAAEAAISGNLPAPQSSIETPSFASKIITTKPIEPPSTTPVIMPEPTPITAINEPRPAPAMPQGMPATAAATPASAMQTAVQLTFSLEIASLQLTPNFKMGSLQVKPISKIVSMRLAPSAQPQPAMNLQVTFELSSVQLGAGAAIGTVRLTPSSAQRPTAITTPSFEISGLQLVSSSAAAPVQLTPTHQAQASVLMTASFQIATVEFSPSFEIASVVLNSTSKNVSVQLPGAGPSAIEAAPVFEIGNVQLSGSNEIGLIQLNPLGGGSGRRG
jgi:tetratricopeptide (TPR) repeat protein